MGTHAAICDRVVLVGLDPGLKTSHLANVRGPISYRICFMDRGCFNFFVFFFEGFF